MVSHCIIIFLCITMLKTYNLLMCYISSEITAIVGIIGILPLKAKYICSIDYIHLSDFFLLFTPFKRRFKQ